MKLIRIAQNKKGTFGVLVKDDRPICVTCEDPWNDNAVGTSCIPAGTYHCAPHSGAKYKDVWALENVPGRTAILIHQGNTIKDTRGCILVGRHFGNLHGYPAILDSRVTLQMLRLELDPEFDLEIINAY